MTEYLRTFDTGRTVTVTVAGQPVTGQWRRLLPIMPGAGAVSAEDNAYRARNAGKADEIAIFQNLQYCLPSTGPRRLKGAVMAPPTGPVDATKPGPVPLQGYSQEGFDRGQGRSDKGTDRGLSAWGALGTREAEAGCQNMIITTPDPTPTAMLPGLVRIHGGGSNYLSNADDRGCLDRMALRGIVGFNIGYRTGNVGHHYLPGMEDEPDYVGVNLSLSDVIAALQFAGTYGDSFGVDRDNLTMIGGSAGANKILCLAANRDYDDLYVRYIVDSPSAGTDPRVAFEPVAGQQSLYQWAEERELTIRGMAALLTDTQNPLLTLADAIEEVGYVQAVREHMSIWDFLAVAEGRRGVAVNSAGQITTGYTPTRSLTVCNDGVTVTHKNNREAAKSGAFSAKPAMISVASFEASVLGGAALSGNAWFFTTQLHHIANGLTTHQFAESPVFNTEGDGSPAVPAWATINMALPRLPWGAGTEPNAILFSAGYWHAAYCVARAIEEAGGTAYLQFMNYRAEGKTSTNRAGHTDCEPLLYDNPPWMMDPPGAGNTEPITAKDLLIADAMAQKVANFCKHGDPNTPYDYPKNFNLFEVPLPDVLTPFDPVSKNWNLIGGTGRNAINSPATITNRPGWWAHLMDYLDTRVWGEP